jgi:hypothetical protein
MRRIIAVIGMAGLVLGASARAQGASAGSVIELQGAWIIDGYTFEPGDRSPRGTIAYDGEANRFTGTYVGLKLPADRPELHVWLYDTRARQAQHIGKVDYKPNTIGKAKGSFSIGLPAAIKGGKFGRYEIVAFSAEASGTKPKQPSGSAIQASQKPAFYLYAPLPGSTVPGVYCGHGQDFSYTSNQDHVCYD